MSATKTVVSVIIPTHNRAKSLQRTLDALAQQSYSAAETETIVVADGCTDNTIKMLQAYSAPFCLQILEQDGKGAGAARNYGSAHANGKLLLFLDDDVVPEPGLIRAHVHAHQQQAGQIVMGPYPTALSGRTSLFNILMRLWWATKFNALQSESHRNTYRDLLSGNLSLEKAIFQSLGGFDPAIRGAGGEDYEFGVRVIKENLPLCFAKDALAYHYEHESMNVRRAMERSRQEGRASVQIGRRHSELRSSLLLDNSNSPALFVVRLVRRLALDLPDMGDFLVNFLAQFLRPLEMLHVRGSWFRLYGLIREYWYWRGVRDELGGRVELENFVQAAPAKADNADLDLDLDLKSGLAAAVQHVDEIRPLSICLRYGQYVIGRIPAIPGAESLRGRHLSFILATQFAESLAKAIALETALPGDNHPVTR